MSLNRAAAAALATARVDVDLDHVDPMSCDPITAADVRSSARSARANGRDELADSLDELCGSMLADEHHTDRRLIAAAVAVGAAAGFLTGPWSLLPVA